MFDFGTETFWRLVHELRENMLSVAANEGVDLIFTSAYSHPEDPTRAIAGSRLSRQQVASSVSSRLTCENKVLESRLQSPSRAKMGKPAYVEAFRSNAP